MEAQRSARRRVRVGSLGAVAAAPVVGTLHERTGSPAAVMAVLAGVTLVTLGCA